MSDKIHPPTPRRRQQAKEQGRAPRSGDLVSAGLLLATTGMLHWFGPGLTQGLMASLDHTLHQPALLSTDRWQAFQMIATAMAAAGWLVVPILIAMMMCGVAINLLQAGWSMTPSKLLPNANRLSPLKRLQTIWSPRALGRFAITVLKLLAVIAVSITVVRTSLPGLIAATGMPLAAIAALIFGTLTECCGWIGFTLLGFAAVDYALAWWQHERDLMMTDLELRDEMRDAERSRQTPTTARTQAVQAVT
ncbi:EscU/YscU/HrcU family type III secretion system export apparatus switch protein [Stieleria sp. TO1_6]|uniref:EscU/YscU/HrcU family type III secretion system export apparatus switch protein n=1 Tax=Stieleria tagensis TaxID=2956795 RepID=UPI00209B83B2|nr:EscU/YscU/HrcU family type III secretion system export apparatus switch protein [Stieleria tagensis]MCO8120341.1 EscU/YscU/HrcU family type III secretion system export apparatus switch protein [Stieleria tagensis]